MKSITLHSEGRDHFDNSPFYNMTIRVYDVAADKTYTVSPPLLPFSTVVHFPEIQDMAAIRFSIRQSYSAEMYGGGNMSFDSVETTKKDIQFTLSKFNSICNVKSKHDKPVKSKPQLSVEPKKKEKRPGFLSNLKDKLPKSRKQKEMRMFEAKK